MGDLPDDIMKVADAVAMQVYRENAEDLFEARGAMFAVKAAIARAILAERERCATSADPVKEQLAEALRPFAIFAEHHPGSATHRSFLQLLVCPEGDDHPKNYGPHFQRARAALEAYEKESSNAPA